MKKRARLLALLMALVMVVAMFAACGGEEDPATTTTAATTDATTTAATTPAGPNLQGYNFEIVNGNRILPQTNEDGSYTNADQEEFAEKLEELQTRLGITITNVPMPEGDQIEVMISAAMGQVKLGDIIYSDSDYFFSVANAGGLRPMDDQAMIDAGLNLADATRWYQPVTKLTKLLGKTWGLGVASKYITVQTGYFVAFNKDLCAAAGYPDMYQLVRDGEWTWEVYRDVARQATKDTDGDGTPDIWGTGATAWGEEALTNGAQYVDEVDGKWVVTIDSEAGVEALQFLYDMNYGDQTRWDVSSGECRTAFANGTIAFNWCSMGHIDGPNSAIYPAIHDYGILPMPKGPRATEYISAQDYVRAIIMQAANQNVAETVAILNEYALIANHTSNFVDMLNDGRCRTEEDYEMMVTYIIPNLYRNNMAISEGIDLWVDDNDMGGGLINDVSYNGMTPQQAIETNKDMIQAALDEFFRQ
ncbi:MAG: extracellular solute-binding protein [Ruminococcaceae bacterium]|nr:extracellular solute-binding protein [Oscillospiraceae bacterium]